MTDDKKFLTPTGRFYSGGLLPRPHNIPAILPAPETVIPVGIDFAKTEQAVARYFRVPRDMLEETRSSFVVQIKVVDQASASLKRLRNQLKYYQLAVYYGHRIAFLLSSADPRQRKRGKRLRAKKDGGLWDVGYNLTDYQAKALAEKYRERYPDVRKFWETNLGEPWDPSRYRKG